MTGNTGIDAVLYVRDGLARAGWKGDAGANSIRKEADCRDAHRRESFGEASSDLRALAAIADRGDVQVVYPVHPNPNVQDPVQRYLAGHPHIRLIEPMSYVPFCGLDAAGLSLITDSGGIQEEGPSLGKPILVLREKTERPEAVTAGTVKLVGTDEERIAGRRQICWDRPEAYGHGAHSQSLRRWLGQRPYCGLNPFIPNENFIEQKGRINAPAGLPGICSRLAMA